MNLTTDSEMAEFDYNAQMAYVAQIQAGSIDIMVMPEKLYQTLKKNEPFADLKELMGEEAFEKFGLFIVILYSEYKSNHCDHSENSRFIIHPDIFQLFLWPHSL